MKFKFETGEVIDVFDPVIADLLRQDKRYKEITGKKNTTSDLKDDDTNGKIQK